MPEPNFHNVDYANTKKQIHVEPRQLRYTKCNQSDTKLCLMKAKEPDEKDEYHFAWVCPTVCVTRAGVGGGTPSKQKKLTA